MKERKMTEEYRLKRQNNFIEKAKKLHVDENGDSLYDYSKVYYINSETPVTIICKKHGEFHILPKSHLSGKKCRKCKRRARKTTDEFIKEAQAIHKNEDGTPKYDYSITKYVNKRESIEYICPIHGKITQIAEVHLKGSGCRFCAFERITALNRKKQDEFIKEVKEIHKDKNIHMKKQFIRQGKKE